VSRRERGAASRGRRAPPPTGAGQAWRRGHRSRVVWISVTAALAALAVILPRVMRAGAPPDPLARLSAIAAADSADRLVQRGRFFEALPYIERVERVAGVEATDSDFEARTATTENNATIQVHARGGMVIPVTRSTIERVALIRQSMLRLDRAERKSTHAVQRRNIIAARAGQLAVWGLVREGYAEYQRAHEIQALDGRALSEAGWIEKMLQDPTQVLAEPAAVP
jgi:hypothetical protein